MEVKNKPIFVLSIALVLVLTGLILFTVNRGKDNGDVASGSAVSGASTTGSALLGKTKPTEEKRETTYAWHKSNIDISDYSIEARMGGVISKFDIDKNSHYSFTIKNLRQYTDDVATALICKDKEVVGFISFSDGSYIPTINKKWSCTTKTTKYKGGYIGNKNEGVDVFIDSFEPVKGKDKGIGAFEVTMADESEFNYFINALTWSKSSKTYLNAEKHMMVFFSTGGSLTLDVKEDSPWYMYRERVKYNDPNAQVINICKDNELWATIYYTSTVDKLSDGHMNDWKKETDSTVLLGASYIERINEDNEIVKEYNDEQIFIHEDEEEDVDGGEKTIIKKAPGYEVVIIKDVTSYGKSVYKGQMTIKSNSLADINTIFADIDVSYAAG